MLHVTERALRDSAVIPTDLLPGTLSPTGRTPRPGHIPTRTTARRRRVGISVLVALAGTAAALAYPFMINRATPVAAESVRLESATRVLSVNGRIRPRLTVDVRARQPGPLTELLVREGDLVEVGQVIGRVADAAQRELVAQATSAGAVRRRELEQSERDLARSAGLARSGFATQASLEKAELEVQRAREDVSRLEAAGREARVRLADYEIRAPFDGRVLLRPVDPGQVVDTTTVIYRIATRERPEVEADVDELYAAELRPGLPARLLPIGSVRTYAGEISYVSPRIDPATGGRTIRLRFLEDVPEEGRPVGLTVATSIVVEARDQATVVRRTAIADQRSRHPYVLLISEGRARRREVTFIDWPGQDVMVSGVEAGAVVAREPWKVPLDPTVRLATAD